jgi:hypothetical protein
MLFCWMRSRFQSLLYRRTSDERQRGHDTQAEPEREHLVQSENELVAFPLLDIVGKLSG